MDSIPLDSSESSITPIKKIQKGAYLSLVILSVINMLNFIDRYITSSTKELVIADLNISDAQSSLPLTCFLIVYMIGSPIFGTLADMGMSRHALLMFGIGVWSLSTAATFFATEYWVLLVTRTIVGVGEASYGVIAPMLIADLFHPEIRNKALTFYLVAMPIGSALGFVLGGVLGDTFGWHYAFLICGLPGVLIMFAILLIKDPGVGIYDEKVEPLGICDSLLLLKGNYNYLFVVIGGMFIDFALGGIADWLPAFIVRYYDISLSTAGIIVGAATVVGGLGGSIIGSFLGDFVISKNMKQGYFFISGLGALISSITFGIGFIWLPNLYIIVTIIFIVQLTVWWYIGLVNAIIANSTDVRVRSRAYGIYIFFINLGSAGSPLLMGFISDITESLQIAMYIVPISFALCGITWFLAWRFVDEQTPSTSNDIPLRSPDDSL